MLVLSLIVVDVNVMKKILVVLVKGPKKIVGAVTEKMRTAVGETLKAPPAVVHPALSIGAVALVEALVASVVVILVVAVVPATGNAG